MRDLPKTLPAPMVVTGGLLGVLLLGTLDYATGAELSFALFYLVPVAFVSWYLGFPAGLVCSALAAATWHTANRLAGEVYSHASIPYWNSATRLGFFSAVAWLLSRLHAVLRSERAMADTDFLTGALSSRAFYRELEDEVERCRRHGHPFALMYLDADNFKAVNDRLGHLTGDELLMISAQTMMDNLRVIDRMARLGGDEFSVLLPHTDAQAADYVATKLRAALLEVMHRNDWPVTFSFGVLACKAPPPTIDELIRLADDLMYTVKRSGKNAVTLEQYGG